MRDRRRIVLLLLLAAVAAVAIALIVRACTKEEPRDILGRLKPAPSGVVRAEVNVQLSGLAALAGPLRLTFEGPFVDPRPGAVPQLDLDVLGAGGGRRIEGGLIVTADRSFVGFEGRDYAVRSADDRRAREAFVRSLEALPPFLRRVHPGPFDPGPQARLGEDEEVGGETLKRVEGPLDVEATVAVAESIVASLSRSSESVLPARAASAPPR